MDNEIIISKKDELIESENQNVFTDFSLPALVLPVYKKEQLRFRQIIEDIPVVAGILSRMKDATEWKVVLSSGMRDAISKGVAHFGKSHIHPGEFAANIYDQKGKLITQVAVENGLDITSLADASANLAMMNAIHHLSIEIEQLKQKVYDIYVGQQTDRLGTVIGAVRAYCLALPTFNPEEQRRAAYMALTEMQKGIAQMHFHYDYIIQNLKGLPNSNWELVIKNLIGDTAVMRKGDENLTEILNGLHQYAFALTLEDMIMVQLGCATKQIIKSHQPLTKFVNRIFDTELLERLRFLNEVRANEISSFVESYNRSFGELDVNLTTGLPYKFRMIGTDIEQEQILGNNFIMQNK
jgi:hypothetical protein